MHLLYACSAFGLVNKTISLLHCLIAVLLPTNGKVDMNNTNLLSFHCPNRILLIGSYHIFDSSSVSRLGYIHHCWILPFLICANCTTSQYLVLSLQHNKQLWCRILIIHVQLSVSIQIFIQSGWNSCFHKCFLGCWKMPEELKFCSHFFPYKHQCDTCCVHVMSYCMWCMTYYVVMWKIDGYYFHLHDMSWLIYLERMSFWWFSKLVLVLWIWVILT